jgi:hypothetical protein
MNIYQKKLNKLVKYSIMYYQHIWKERESFRWHRCQERLMRKQDKENNIDGIILNLKSAKDICKQDNLI